MEIKDQPTARIDCNQHLIKAVRFNADGQYSLTCGSDRTIKLWRPSKLLQLKCYKGHSSDVTDCSANHDSSQFVSCSNDKSIILWDVESGKLLRRFRNFAPFNTICYGYGSNTVLAGSLDGTVRIYDLKATNAWEPIQSLTEADDSITCCRVHNNLIFTTSLDKGLRTYDVRKGSLSIDNLPAQLNHVSVSQDASTLLVGCVRSNPILVERAESPSVLCEFKGNKNDLFKIEACFVLNDSHIAAGSEDGKVYIWSITQDQEPQMALNHQLNVNPPVIQSISSDSLDYLLTACGSYMLLWSL